MTYRMILRFLRKDRSQGRIKVKVLSYSKSPGALWQSLCPSVPWVRIFKNAGEISPVESGNLVPGITKLLIQVEYDLLGLGEF